MAMSAVGPRTLLTGQHDCSFYSGPLPHRHVRVEELANRKGVTMAQIATAWCLAKEGVTAPIVGTTKLDNLKEILGVSSSVFSCRVSLILVRRARP